MRRKLPPCAPAGSLFARSFTAPLPHPFYSPFNSWDRDPSLIIDPETGAVTTTKAFDILTKNFIIANVSASPRRALSARCGHSAAAQPPASFPRTLPSSRTQYNSLGAVDNDDGSSYYKSISNFFVCA